MLFSAYRIDQYADPEGFKASLGAVLEQYPDNIIQYVCDPRTGIQRRCKFPPTISEIVAECDDRIATLQRHEKFRNWGKKEVLELGAPQEQRPTREELQAKYGENWGLKSLDEPKRKPKAAPTKEELAAHYAKHNLGFGPKFELDGPQINYDAAGNQD